MKTKTLILVCLFLGIGLTQLSAQQNPYVGKSEIWLGFWIPCSEEWVEGIVTVHSVLQFTDEGYQIILNQHPMRGELVCPWNGNTYKIVGGIVGNQKSVFNPGGGAIGVIYVQNLHLMGNGVNFIAHVTWTTVINQDWEWVHDYYIENIQCN